MYIDQEETEKVQESRIEYFKNKVHQQLTEDGRNAEITADLVLQARANLSDNMVNRLQDAIVERDDQAVALGKDLHCCDVLSGTFHGPDGISKFVEDRDIGLLEETGRCPEERDEKLQSNSGDIGDVEVMHLVLFCAWRGKKSLKSGRVCMLVDWMG